MGVNDAAEMLEVAKVECVRLERALAEVVAVADRELWRGQTMDSSLRELHKMELFGDCVEDGQRFPCHTVQALDIFRAHGTGVPVPKPEGRRS